MRLRAALAVGGFVGGLALLNRRLEGSGGTSRIGSAARRAATGGGAAELAYTVAGRASRC
jgi:hypothetical protein